ncbi:MAG: winged helix-turn-helix transcriptional regulator [Rhodothermales bacterium]
MPEKKSELDPNTLRSQCPIANSLDIIGDRWTLLIIRDILINGKHRFKEFQDIPEAFPTNILADRLKRLEKWGLIEKRAYQEYPVRYAYHLTEKGSTLEPVLRAIEKWGTDIFPTSTATEEA